MAKNNFVVEVTFNECFKYQNQTFLLRDLYRSDKARKEKIVNHFTC